MCDAQVPDPNQMLAEGCTKMYCRTARCILHHVDAYLPSVGEMAPVPDHSTFLALLDEKDLGCKVDVWADWDDPSGKRDDVAVPSLIIYCLQNFSYVLGDGGVITILGRD